MSSQARHIMGILFGLAVAMLPVWMSAKAATVTPLFARGYTVLPAPQQVDLKQGDFEFGNGWRLQLGSGVKADDVAIESLKDELSKRYSIDLQTGGKGRGSAVTLQIQRGSVQIGHATDKDTTAIEKQAYRLELASSGIQVTANTDTGLLYGVDTLVQLVKSEKGNWLLPNAKITDWPDLGQRIMYWDNHYFLQHADVLKRVLRQAAFYKINGLVLKLCGHYQFASAPAVAEPYALSPEQLQELTNYGLRYHVQLIPYLDSPGHMSFLLKHPEYKSLREYPDSNYEICETNPESVKLITGMYQNLLDGNRGGNYFFLSTDEPYYVGLAHNSQCDEAARANELGTRGKVLAEFVTKLASYLHDRGRTIIFWGYSAVPGIIALSDVSSYPSYLVSGIIQQPPAGLTAAFKAHGIREMIYTEPEGVEPFFPSYYSIAPCEPCNKINTTRRLNRIFNKVLYNGRKTAALAGVNSAAWGDTGLHPETFWLGNVAGLGWAWYPGSPGPDEAASDFYRLFYGTNLPSMARTYQLMSTQAEFWNSSWDRAPSSQRKPIFGSPWTVYNVRHPAHDQVLPLPPVPQGKYLRLPFDWSKENARRVKLAQNQMPNSAELFDLLYRDLGSTKLQHYNLELFLSIAGLYKQNLQMIEEMDQVNNALKDAQRAAAEVQFSKAVSALDKALDIAVQIRDQRNVAYHELVAIGYQSCYPRVAKANGRTYLNEVDDVKDDMPVRTVDMSYLIYREKILPLGKWYDQVESVRNQYAQTHSLPSRNGKLGWEQTGNGPQN